MGTQRTFIAWLVALSLLQLFPHVTYADSGPGKEVRAIRHDLPLLLAGYPNAGRGGIDDVFVDGTYAIVARGVAHNGGTIDAMAYRLGTWWLLGELYATNGVSIACSRAGNAYAATERHLDDLGIPYPLTRRAESDLPFIQPQPAPTPPFAGGYTIRAPNIDCDPGTGAPFAHRPIVLSGSSLYGFDLWLAKNDADGATELLNYTGRAPTEAESWTQPYENSYFFFSVTLQSSATVHVGQGTTIDVWFPFVLDPSTTYSLTIGHVTPIIGPINGRLKNNTLDFMLPAFAVEPGAELMGEIDGDPYRRF